MPPQDNNQNQQPSSGGADMPGGNVMLPGEGAVYSGPPPRRSRLKIIGLVLGSLLLLAGGGVTAYFLAGEPEQQPSAANQTAPPSGNSNAPAPVPLAPFETMLKNAMNVEYAHRTITYKGGALELTLEAQTAFPELGAPRSQGTFASRVQSGGITIEASGRFRVLGNEQYIKLEKQKYDTATAIPAEALAQLPEVKTGNAIKGTWLRLDNSAQVQSLLNNVFLIDPVVLTSLNRPGNELVVGNVPAGTQQQLLDFVATENLYTVTSEEATTLDGQAATQFIVELDTTKLSSYLGLLASSFSPSYEARAGLLTIYVDEQTQLPLRLELSEGGQNVTVEYSDFTTPVTVAAPTGAIDASGVI